jgi:hypothetical protein
MPSSLRTWRNQDKSADMVTTFHAFKTFVSIPEVKISKDLSNFTDYSLPDIFSMLSLTL